MASEFFFGRGGGIIKYCSLILVCFWRNKFMDLSPTLDTFKTWLISIFNTLFFLPKSIEISTKSWSVLVQFCWKFPLNELVIVASFPSSVNIYSRHLFRTPFVKNLKPCHLFVTILYSYALHWISRDAFSIPYFPLYY